MYFSDFTADIDDMKICYVLRVGDNATSDIFHFMVEDGGEYSKMCFCCSQKRRSLSIL